MLAGQAPAGCRKCVAEEESGAESKRLQSLKQDFLIPPEERGARPNGEGKISYLGFEIGNACNLSCIMCHPSSSSLWNRDAEAAGYEKSPVFRPSLEKLRHLALHVESLELLGGESFLAPQLEELLGIMEAEGNPDGTFIKIVTNATVFPSEKIRNMLSRFAQVKIICSVDAIGARNEYIRYPSQWETVNSTVRRYLDWAQGSYNLSVGINTVVSAFSLGGFGELLDWWTRLSREKGMDEDGENIFFGYVIEPELQSVHALGRRFRESVAKEITARNDHPVFRKAKGVMEYALSKDRPDLLPRLRAWTERMDKARGLSAAICVPEIFEG
jgi:hypothetical protein